MTSLTGDMLADGTRDIDAPTAAGPVRDAERITALDVTRGIALLGIVLVNVHYKFQFQSKD